MNLNYEAVVTLAIRNQKILRSIEGVVDTGFTGFLSLPKSIIAELKLTWKYRDRATLGDGSETVFDIYSANVIWDGSFREIEVNAAETEPLIGMSMLRDYRLQIDTKIGGIVVVEALSE